MTTAVPATRTRPWVRRAGGVAVLVVAACCVPGDELAVVTALLATLAVLVVAGCAVARSWALVASALLPAVDRAPWRAEVQAVLHAAQDTRERRRQLRGFVLGLPACVLTSWRLALRRS